MALRQFRRVPYGAEESILSGTGFWRSMIITLVGAVAGSFLYKQFLSKRR